MAKKYDITFKRGECYGLFTCGLHGRRICKKGQAEKHEALEVEGALQVRKRKAALLLKELKEGEAEARQSLLAIVEEISSLKRMVIGLSLAVAFIGVELLGFFSGITMFMTTTAMISIASHACASVLLAHFVLDEWDCNLYWWIFVFCSLIPAMIEVVMATSTLILRKG